MTSPNNLIAFLNSRTRVDGRPQTKRVKLIPATVRTPRHHG